MKVANMNWLDVEAVVKQDQRCILPIGSTEQHAQLSLCVDMILAEKMALDVAEPLNIPVFPVMPYGLAPYFAAYPVPLAFVSKRLWRSSEILLHRFISQVSEKSDCQRPWRQ